MWTAHSRIGLRRWPLTSGRQNIWWECAKRGSAIPRSNSSRLACAMFGLFAEMQTRNTPAAHFRTQPLPSRRKTGRAQSSLRPTLPQLPSKAEESFAKPANKCTEARIKRLPSIFSDFQPRALLPAARFLPGASVELRLQVVAAFFA